MVELGFSAVASLAQTWDSAEPEEDEDGGKALGNWKAGCITVASTFGELLQRAWLPTSIVSRFTLSSGILDLTTYLELLRLPS